MLTPETFLKKEKEFEKKEKVVYSTTFPVEDSEKIKSYSEKYGFSKSQTIRYFTILGMQAHKKRAKLRKQYESIAEEDMIRESIIEEFHERIKEQEKNSDCE